MADAYFDINLVINLLAKDYPERVDIINQLESLEFKKFIRQPYIVINKVENDKIVECLDVEDNIEGTIVIDITESGLVKGIELINQISHA